MPVSKYAKYFTPLPLDHGGGGEVVGRFVGAKHFEGAPFYFVWHPIPVLKEPYTMIKNPHNHDFDQYLGFFGPDLMDIENLGKDIEIELYLGEESEKFIINKPQMVHIAKGLIHGPLVFKTVNTPIMLVDIVMAPEYKKVSSLPPKKGPV
jgi:hypothetical protein